MRFFKKLSVSQVDFLSLSPTSTSDPAAYCCLPVKQCGMAPMLGPLTTTWNTWKPGLKLWLLPSAGLLLVAVVDLESKPAVEGFVFAPSLCLLSSLPLPSS